MYCKANVAGYFLLLACIKGSQFDAFGFTGAGDRGFGSEVLRIFWSSPTPPVTVSDIKTNVGFQEVDGQ